MEEAPSPKAKAGKKKGPSEDDVGPPKSKKAKKQEEEPQDEAPPKSKSSKKKKEPVEKTAASKTKEPKTQEPPEEEAEAPKPKKTKKGKDANGASGEKSPRLKNGLSASEPKPNSTDTPGEDSSSETEKVSVCLSLPAALPVALREFILSSMWVLGMGLARLGDKYFTCCSHVRPRPPSRQCLLGCFIEFREAVLPLPSQVGVTYAEQG